MLVLKRIAVKVSGNFPKQYHKSIGTYINATFDSSTTTKSLWEFSFTINRIKQSPWCIGKPGRTKISIKKTNRAPLNNN